MRRQQPPKVQPNTEPEPGGPGLEREIVHKADTDDRPTQAASVAATAPEPETAPPSPQPPPEEEEAPMAVAWPDGARYCKKCKGGFEGESCPGGHANWMHSRRFPRGAVMLSQ
jgi:hypothetical protein